MRLGTDFKCRRCIPEGFICALIALHQNMCWRNCLELPARHFASGSASHTQTSKQLAVDGGHASQARVVTNPKKHQDVEIRSDISGVQVVMQISRVVSGGGLAKVQAGGD